MSEDFGSIEPDPLEPWCFYFRLRQKPIRNSFKHFEPSIDAIDWATYTVNMNIDKYINNIKSDVDTLTSEIDIVDKKLQTLKRERDELTTTLKVLVSRSGFDNPEKTASGAAVSLTKRIVELVQRERGGMTSRAIISALQRERKVVEASVLSTLSRLTSKKVLGRENNAYVIPRTADLNKRGIGKDNVYAD